MVGVVTDPLVERVTSRVFFIIHFDEENKMMHYRNFDLYEW
jgi:hypothetical protein